MLYLAPCTLTPCTHIPCIYPSPVISCTLYPLYPCTIHCTSCTSHSLPLHPFYARSHTTCSFLTLSTSTPCTLHPCHTHHISHPELLTLCTPHILHPLHLVPCTPHTFYPATLCSAIICRSGSPLVKPPSILLYCICTVKEGIM